jgi:hypothetical protein
MRLRLLAQDLDVNAHPRDLIEIHKRMFTEKSRAFRRQEPGCFSRSHARPC